MTAATRMIYDTAGRPELAAAAAAGILRNRLIELDAATAAELAKEE